MKRTQYTKGHFSLFKYADNKCYSWTDSKWVETFSNRISSERNISVKKAKELYPSAFKR